MNRAPRAIRVDPGSTTRATALLELPVAQNAFGPFEVTLVATDKEGTEGNTVTRPVMVQ